MDPNRPDIARFAGAHPLNSASNSDASDSERDMDDSEDGGDMAHSDAAEEDLVNTARAAESALQAAKHFVDHETEASEDVVTRERGPASGLHAERTLPGHHPSLDAEEPESCQRRRTTRTEDLKPSPREGRSDAPGDAAGVLARLKETSPQASPAESRGRPHTNGGAREDLPATSPTLREYAIPVSEASPHRTLPAMHAPLSPHSETSPHGEKQNLPPLHSHLNQLAEAASKESSQDLDALTNGATPNRRSISSVGGGPGQSPSTATGGRTSQERPQIPVPYASTQPPPQIRRGHQPNGQPPPNHTSPTTSFADNSTLDSFRQNRELLTLSPPPSLGTSGSSSYYFNSRLAQPSEHGPPYSARLSPEGSYTASSSNDGRLRPGPNASMRGSTAPDQRMDLDGAPARPPQRQPSGNLPSGGFKCTFPDCPAPPFQTQYLLNSHANVHSQDRPHYCPVKGCLRAEGGTGFKRKNEMIRHGLVHTSPGYVCPFCPDREHKYPRPDNLQRHVRGNHKDKRRDDPALKDVLSQRSEGNSSNRRRRHGH